MVSISKPALSDKLVEAISSRTLTVGRPQVIKKDASLRLTVQSPEFLFWLNVENPVVEVSENDDFSPKIEGATLIAIRDLVSYRATYGKTTIKCQKVELENDGHLFTVRTQNSGEEGEN